MSNSPSHSAAIDAISAKLAEFGLELGDHDEESGLYGLYEISETWKQGEHAGYLKVSFYRMPSGRLELTVYVT